MQGIEELYKVCKWFKEVVGGLNEGWDVFQGNEDVLVVISELLLVQGWCINAYVGENSVHPLHHLSKHVFCALMIVEHACGSYKCFCKRLEETGLDMMKPSPECLVSEHDVE